MSSKPDLADTIFRAFDRSARAAATGERRRRRCGSSARGTRARRWRSARSRSAPGSPTRGSTSRTPTTSTVLLASMGFRPVDTPVVITPTGVLAAPDARRVRRAPRPHVPRRCPGTCSTSSSSAPARPGSAAAVYGASEGPRHGLARRGRRSAARRARARASRTTSGSRTASPARSSRPRRDPGAAARRAAQRAVRSRRPAQRETGSTWSCSADGSEIPCRTVIVASGARYQRLAVDDLERFEGAGVYYAATDLEARICSGVDVIVVGGGNSAGSGRDLSRAAGQPRLDRDPRRATSRRACRTTSSSGSKPTRASSC